MEDMVRWSRVDLPTSWLDTEIKDISPMSIAQFLAAFGNYVTSERSESWRSDAEGGYLTKKFEQLFR